MNWRGKHGRRYELYSNDLLATQSYCEGHKPFHMARTTVHHTCKYETWCCQPGILWFTPAVASITLEHHTGKTPLMARFMVLTCGPSGADRTQMDPMLVPLTLLSGTIQIPKTVLGCVVWNHAYNFTTQFELPPQNTKSTNYLLYLLNMT